MGFSGNRLLFRSALTAVIGSMVLAGCASMPQSFRSVHLTEQGTLGQCAVFFASLDQQTAAAKVRDAGSFRIPGYPYLRVNRFLASFRKEARDGPKFDAWLQQMQRLDQRARFIEIANQSVTGADTVKRKANRMALQQRIVSCGDVLKKTDFELPDSREALRQNIVAPDDYIPLRRLLGLYPVSSFFVSRGINTWHKEARSQYSIQMPENWKVLSYHSQPPKSVVTKPAKPDFRTSVDALGIPFYSKLAKFSLFQTYAPIWQIQTHGPYDRPGKLIWKSAGLPGVDSRKPLVYTKLSYTRFEGQILTQLNYVIWFSSRPLNNDWDIYGGVLDGVTFRITLDPEGIPLAYESMHNCGCFYRVYPGSHLAMRADFKPPEMPLVLASPVIDWKKARVAVALSTGKHYVQHLYSSVRSDDHGRAYEFADYSTLLSLQDGDRRRSLFGEDGIVPASVRLERFLLWPTGVYSPGAMRQFGRHAIAFVGERHFDDPFLLQKMFRGSR